MKKQVTLEQCMLDESHRGPLDAAALQPLVGTKNGNGVWQRIISEIPPHRVYMEPFWGRGSIARRMRPPEIIVGCDLDPAAIDSGKDLATMFRVDAFEFLTGYFPLGFAGGGGRGKRSTIATFGGAAWSEHFVYLDPPYLIDRDYYGHGFDEEDHMRLLSIFRALPCPAALSGYWTDLYADELCGVRHIEIPTATRAAKRVTEILWCNYPAPARLHDARFIGGGRRERERIRRRVQSWRSNFAAMTPLERQAVREALDAAAADDSWSGGEGPPRSPAAKPGKEQANEQSD